MVMSRHTPRPKVTSPPVRCSQMEISQNTASITTAIQSNNVRPVLLESGEMMLARAPHCGNSPEVPAASKWLDRREIFVWLLQTQIFS